MFTSALALVTVLQLWVGIAPKVAPSILRVEIASQGEPAGVCSAAVIGKDYVLTAAHCVPIKPEGRSLAVGKKHAEIARVNYVLDLAVLRVEGLDAPALALRTSEVEIGTDVVMVGYAYGALKPKFTFGHVADIEDESITVGLLADITVVHGDSGGAICDTEGRLISITQAGLLDGLGALAVGATPVAVKQFAGPFLTTTK